MANDGHGQPGGRKIDVALRILQAFGLIGVAIAGGFLIGAGIAGMFDSPEEYRLVAGALGVSFVLATLEKFVTQAPLLWRWIWTGVGDGLSSFSAFAFLAVVTFATALLAPPIPPIPPAHGPKEEPAPSLATAHTVLFVNAPPRERERGSLSESVFLVPFFDEARGCDVKSEAFQKGSSLDKSTKKFLTRLAAGFRRCARSTKPVRVQVRGFASSKPFDCPNDVGGSRSRELNRLIANARARAVVKQLIDGQADAHAAHPGAAGDVIIEPIEWATYEAMKSGQRWDDQEEGKYSTSRAILTRRAEVRLVESGDCEIASIASTDPS